MPLVECGFPRAIDQSPSDTLVTHGPTLWVDIGLDPAFDYTIPGTPRSQAQQVPALVDTGARESCIDDALAQSIGLPLIDQQTVLGVGGAHSLNVYMAHIYYPAFGFSQWGRFAGVKLSDGGQSHKALIGRTLLRGMMMVYDGRSGTVTLAI